MVETVKHEYSDKFDRVIVAYNRKDFDNEIREVGAEIVRAGLMVEVVNSFSVHSMYPISSMYRARVRGYKEVHLGYLK
jgi:hypothetical protein